jgi:hypothetical protein
MWRYASGGSQWLARLASLMVAAELLHLSANAIESTNDGGAPAASIGTAIEACSSIIQTEKDRHRLAAAYFNRAGWLANDLNSFGGGATAAPTKPGDAAKPIEATKRR